jgi:hypothetical protein
MSYEQDWQTDLYKGMAVHVSALARNDARSSWDYSVRIAQPGEDATSQSDLAAESGDDTDYPTKAAAITAGFARGYAIVDELLK